MQIIFPYLKPSLLQPLKVRENLDTSPKQLAFAAAAGVPVTLVSKNSDASQPKGTISSVSEVSTAPQLVVAKAAKTGYFISTSLGLAANTQGLASMMTAAELQELPFEKAAEIWLEHKKIYTKAKTIASYRDYIARLEQAFTGMQLRDIHIGHIEEYQKRNRDLYHPTVVNHDTNTLSQILRKADRWDKIRPHYHALPVPKWQPPKVLTEEQEDAFFKLAASSPDFSLAYWVSSLTNNTSASGVELRMLQVKHLLLDAKDPIVYVPDGKNDYRPRAIWLNEVGVKQLRRIVERASSLGATDPEHYVFPFRVKRGLFDPNRPASDSWLKKRWKKLVDAAMEAKIIPFRITPHNLRHQIITKLLENGTPEHTVMAIAGHVRREMLEHYSHTRLAAKKAALSAIAPRRKGQNAG